MTVDNGRNLGLAADTAGSALAELGAGLSGELDLRHVHSSYVGSETSDGVGYPAMRLLACYEERVDNGRPYFT
ncbi:hypothetical protein GCM10009837_48840 [Streptomyces durmitorensis]